MGAEFDATIAFIFSLNVKRGEATEREREGVKRSKETD